MKQNTTIQEHWKKERWGKKKQQTTDRTRIGAVSGKPGPEVIKTFSCSTQLSINIFMLINLILLTMPNSFFVGIFIFISRENFMLSWVEHEKSFITLGPIRGLSSVYTIDTSLSFPLQLQLQICVLSEFEKDHSKTQINCSETRKIAQWHQSEIKPLIGPRWARPQTEITRRQPLVSSRAMWFVQNRSSRKHAYITVTTLNSTFI